MANRLVTDIIINLAGNLASKARQYGQSMSSFASQSKAAVAAMNSTLSAASRGIDTWGNRAVLAGGVAAVAFERTFIKTAAEFERYQIMLNQLQGGPEGGAKAMDWIKQFTQDTPFAVAEVTNSFVKLKAFGLDPMNGTMQAIADQTAKMGGTAETFDGIALALGQAWTKGKLQGEEALQLLERGVPVWDYLAKASKEMGQNNGLGYTNEQLQKMASNGQLTRKAIQALIDQMGKQSQGAAKAQMNSWNGMISNMGDTWTLFKADVMESGTFDVLKGELSGLMSQIDEMKKSGEYDKLVDEVGNNLVEAFRTAANAIKDAKEMGQDLIPVLKTIGETANGVADMVGGYENLAKILGSIYLLNKGASFLAPVVKGGLAVGKGVYTAGSWAAGWMAGKGKGQPPMANPTDAFTSLGATPVYVVNMPGSFGGGMGPGDMPGAEPGKPGQPGQPGHPEQPPKPSKLGAALNYGAAAVQAVAVVEMANGVASMLVDAISPGASERRPESESGFAGWTPFNITRAEEREADFKSKNPNEELVMQPPPGLLDVFDEMRAFFTRDVQPMARPDNLAASLDIKVSDDRVTVRTRDTAPGLKVNVDTGPSLMP